MKTILTRLVNNEILTREETRTIMLDITREKYTDIQISAFLTSMIMRGIQPEELLGLRDGLLETGLSINLSDYPVIDIVGTGGDNKNTFNISTCSSFILAGAGYKVAKHGNYAATSTSGASNVIEACGIHFTNDENLLRKSLEKSGFAYLHAPLFAKGMKFVGPVRKAMQIPTCFNLLGPLVNPCHPQNQLLGVASLNQMRLYGEVNRLLGINYSIVYSMDGYDEIALTGCFKVKESGGKESVYQPEDLGMKTVRPEELYGGKQVREALDIFIRVLKNQATEAQINVVLANAAFAIKVLEPQKNLMECLDLARTSLKSGRAWTALQQFIEINS